MGGLNLRYRERKIAQQKVEVSGDRTFSGAVTMSGANSLTGATNVTGALSLDSVQVPAQAVWGTPGTEDGSNGIAIALQINDSGGNAMTTATVLDVYLSDADTGLGLVTTAPDGGIAIGTDGAILVSNVANKHLTVETEADGDVDFVITESGTKTLYAVAVLPTGRRVVSAAITHAT